MTLTSEGNQAANINETKQKVQAMTWMNIYPEPNVYANQNRKPTQESCLQHS